MRPRPSEFPKLPKHEFVYSISSGLTQVTERKNRDLYLVVLGVLLGILGQALYDIFKSYYLGFYPDAPPEIIDAVAAIIAGAIILVIYERTLKN